MILVALFIKLMNQSSNLKGFMNEKYTSGKGLLLSPLFKIKDKLYLLSRVLGLEKSSLMERFIGECYLKS